MKMRYKLVKYKDFRVPDWQKHKKTGVVVMF